MSTKLATLSRLTQVGGLFLLGMYGVDTGSHMLFLFCVCGLATLSIAPRLGVVRGWPLGLAAVIGIGYTGYVYAWWRRLDGVDGGFARGWATGLLVIFLVGASHSVYRRRKEVVLRSKLLLPVIVVLPSVLLMLLATTRWNSDVVQLISGHMSGGDHGAHNFIVHSMRASSGGSSFESPFRMYTYPRAIHFLIANLLEIDTHHPLRGQLVSEYAMSAWFEWLQLAAYVQLFVLVLLREAKTLLFQRILIIPPILLAVASTDNFVSHLFWSGFTTSLAATWLLLIPLAYMTIDSVARRVRSEVIGLLALGVLLWVVYPPYSVPLVFSCTAIVLARMASNCDWSRCKRLSNFVSAPASVVGMAFWFAALGAFVSLLALGRDSPAMQSFLLDGSTYKPSMFSVILWASLVFSLGVPLLERREAVGGLAPLVLLASICGFTAGMAMVVMSISGFGLFDQPYYTQKMFWIVLFLSLPLALRLMFDVLERYLRERSPRDHKRLMVIPVLLVSLLPLVMNRVPAAATRHFSVDWFARSIVLHPNLPIGSSVAFSKVDKLGSHLSNLALKSASDSNMPVDTAISGNTYLACDFIERNSVRLVYTTPNGRAELLESGCSPQITYVEDGTVMVSSHINYFSVSTDVTETFTNTSQGFRLLLRGFLPPEKWGTWAGGYRSALGFSYEEDLNNPLVQLTLRSHPKDEELRRVNIGVNGRIVISRLLALGKPEPFSVSLPAGKKGTRIELTITCERSHEEVLADDPVDGPNACAGLESMRLEEQAD